jgi:photosynthetic reaction center H subunit
MEDNIIIGDFDVAQLVLYAFWIFFFGLIIYLQKETMREGYPLESEVTGKPIMVGPFMPLPKPKTFKLSHGRGEISYPNVEKDTKEIERQKKLKMKATAPWSGSPFEPTGDPMVDGVGPAAWAERMDEPERKLDGELLIVPLRADNEWSIAEQDRDIRGWEVRGCDGEVAGTVKDLWVDRGEHLFRYVEVDVGAAKTVLVPFFCTLINIQFGKYVSVDSITAEQFKKVPKLKKANEITSLEEEKIMAYFAGGKLYATPDRQEPWL